MVRLRIYGDGQAEKLIEWQEIRVHSRKFAAKILGVNVIGFIHASRRIQLNTVPARERQLPRRAKSDL
jgi:hypothetical protein